MKTTIEISDSLFIEAKRRAAKNGTTLRALFEQGLKQVLKQPAANTGYRSPDRRVRGKGLTPAARSAGWAAILEAANER